MARPLPAPDVPVIDRATGCITQIWYDYLLQHQKLTQLPDVSTTAPTNGQTLRYNSTTRLWTPS